MRYPSCNSPTVTRPLVLSVQTAIYQEYVCEYCGCEFKAMFGLIGYAPGSNNEHIDA
ncbi:hypothetical protein DR64_8004 [Paraburkholderia xenovorans LB400]|uniref:hypothetical protein n=1 Tax=Paraburkholderia xenovorans TaxID=36873 RepID=UPI000037E896|nr:hypothetical protein [Paraburkholderia xenovorans]AIP34894.1 hypothetical protein DR64_8004 [Paraburkholderia xenovorans LB400]